jgi:hypothetical protein
VTELSATCPSCGALLDKFDPAAVDGSRPEAGAVLICRWCASLLEAYGDPLGLRLLPADHAAHDDPQIQKMQEDIRGWRRLRRVV